MQEWVQPHFARLETRASAESLLQGLLAREFRGRYDSRPSPSWRESCSSGRWTRDSDRRGWWEMRCMAGMKTSVVETRRGGDLRWTSSSGGAAGGATIRPSLNVATIAAEPPKSTSNCSTSRLTTSFPPSPWA